jgi:23S rRNA pseudouridine2605 synthase
MATERLQKVLARAGIASRRAAEELIVAGRVRVNGRIIDELGAKADPRNDRVEVDGRRIVAEQPVYVIVHKPRGVVSTMSDPEGRPSVKELVGDVPGRVFPIGRLDFATSGVLLATNDGAFADGLMHPRKAVPKMYVLKVKGNMQPDDLERWRQGVRLEDGMTLPAEVRFIRHEEDKTWLELTITEGRNQQIRRMGDATGFRVMRLARVSFAGVSSEGLRPGQWRFLTRDELVAMKSAYGVPERIVSGVASTPAADTTRARPRGKGHGHGKGHASDSTPLRARQGAGGARGRVAATPDTRAEAAKGPGRGRRTRVASPPREDGPAPRGARGERTYQTKRSTRGRRS